MGRQTVLVVDDEQDLADLYAAWLEEEYETITAYDGEAALEAVEESVDVVLLDRNMPGVSGDEVLAEVRNAGYDCGVVMVTAVDPGLDIVEMDFDDYLTKPVSRPQLTRVIENTRIQTDREGPIGDHMTVSNKMETLEGEFKADELERSEEYQELRDNLKELGETLLSGTDEE